MTAENEKERCEWIDIVIKTSVTGIQLSFLLFVCGLCVCGFKIFLVMVCDLCMLKCMYVSVLVTVCGC